MGIPGFYFWRIFHKISFFAEFQLIFVQICGIMTDDIRWKHLQIFLPLTEIRGNFIHDHHAKETH